MANIKKQISDLRAATPKHIQWLLLAVAFVVVLILLTLLIGGKKKTDIPVVEAGTEKLILNPDVTVLDWSDTVVDTTKTETIKIKATAPVKVTKINYPEIDGLKSNSNCQLVDNINPKVVCDLTFTYKPVAVMDATDVTVGIDWHGKSAPAEMVQTHKITLKLGAVAPMIEEVKKEEKKVEPKPEPKPEPVVETKPEPVPVAELEPEPEPVIEEEPAPTPVKEEIIKEVESIAPPAPIVEEEYEPEIPVRAETCSDFAFPGYSAGGNQIGWIKPDAGAYYFHPFSDKDCEKPTGVYNPDTGIITDIDNPGKRIGTDAEHIGYNVIQGGVLPELSNAPAVRTVSRSTQADGPTEAKGAPGRVTGAQPKPAKDVSYKTSDQNAVFASTQPFDRSFILRQYKPIPATIVSEVRADPSLYESGAKTKALPVRATVDRNVYSDNGRNVIIPTGTMLLGYVEGEIPGPYKTIGRMNVNWYQFILPNGLEYNFHNGTEPFSGDSQGRKGILGRGSSDYIEQMVMPMLTAIIPAAVNMIAPISDVFVNQIDLDNNTVVQSGTVRSSEMAKNEIITAWNQVAQKLLVDVMENTVPPFSIAAGTRITVYSPNDLVLHCGDGDKSKSCSFSSLGGQPGKNDERATWSHQGEIDTADESWQGQVRASKFTEWCTTKNGKWVVDESQIEDFTSKGYSYGAVQMICESRNYVAKETVKQDVLYQDQERQYQSTYGTEGNRTTEQTKAFNQDILGLAYDDAGNIVEELPVIAEEVAADAALMCLDGTAPDANGCCTGEVYTDMGDQGFNCCPETGGDCFPPMF